MTGCRSEVRFLLLTPRRGASFPFEATDRLQQRLPALATGSTRERDNPETGKWKSDPRATFGWPSKFSDTAHIILFMIIMIIPEDCRVERH